MRALLSVSDKRGIVQFARELVALKWEIVSTGGTAEALRREGIPVIPIDQVTGFPEMMDGRVKTLHPKVHGALLGRRDNQHDMAAMQQHGIEPIDLVAVNLYPFRETIVRPGTTLAEAIEQIDIGGPSMLRSAAKNHADVVVIVDPDDYSSVIEDLKVGEVGEDKRRALATKVFAHTAAYDAAILGYLSRSEESLPPTLSVGLQRQQALRYGENPHQRAALYVTDEPGLRDMHQLHGKELSFNNLLDVDAAVMAVAPWQSKDARAACVIIKHTTPWWIAPPPRRCATCSWKSWSRRGSMRTRSPYSRRRRTCASSSSRSSATSPRSTSSACGEASSCRTGSATRAWPTSPSGTSQRLGGLPMRNGTICGSPGPRWGLSSRTPSSWCATRRRSESAPAR